MFNYKCLNCNSNITVNQIRKAFLINTTFTCTECKNIYKITTISRVYTILLMVLPVLLQNYLFDIFNNYSIIIYLLWVICIFIISPILLKIKKVDS